MIVRTLPKMGSRLDIDHGALWHGPPFSMACLSSTICCCNPRVFAALRRRKIFRSTEPSSRNIVGKIRCAESAAMPVTSSRPSQPSEPQGLRDCLGSVSLGSAMARVTETSETSCPLPLGVSEKRNCTRLRFAEGGGPGGRICTCGIRVEIKYRGLSSGRQRGRQVDRIVQALGDL